MAVWPLPRITFRELSSIEETRPVALLTTDDVWAVLSSHLNLPVMIQAEPARHSRTLFDYLAENLPSQIGVIYAVGSGAAVEAGKYVASRNNIPLIIIPTALDSAHMLLPSALIEDQEDGRTIREWKETGPATEIIIDWGIIQGAPDAARGAGIVDVLATVTGLLDWRYAAQKGKNRREERFTPWAAGVAADLAKQAIKSSAAIGQGNRDALQTLLHLMMTLVQLSNELEHTRVQQGGEHFLAEIIAAATSYATDGGSLSHAERVGPCLLFISALHGQDPTALRDAMANAGVPLDRIRATDFNLVLGRLETHLAAHGFPYSILNDLDIDSEQVKQALEAADLAIPAETWELPAETIPSLADASIEAPHEAKYAPVPPSTEAQATGAPAEAVTDDDASDEVSDEASDDEEEEQDTRPAVDTENLSGV